MGICCSSEEDNTKKLDKVEPVEDDGEEADEQIDNAGRKKGRTATVNKPPAENQQANASKSHTRIMKVRCHHVYDGDTLTLDDNDANPDERTRVRLVMVDAPELKQKEDGAAGAKALLEKLCPKKCDLEIQIDTREERDKYGRLIGLVWVQPAGGKRVCANAELVSQGAVSFYQPKGSQAFAELGDQYLALQDDALKHRRGIWQHFVDDEVYKTRNGGSYHTKDCEHVRDFKLEHMKRSECIKQGLSGCRTCKP